MLLVIYDSFAILSLLICYVVFMGWVGFRLFRGTQEGVAQCASIVDCTWSLLIELSTANYPNVELPAYGMNQAYTVFFVGYEIIGLYFLQNVLLTTFYSNYLN